MTDKEKLEKMKKLADAMYYAAQLLTTDASRLHKAMDEYHKFIINEYHNEEPTIPDIVDEHFYEMLGEEPELVDNGDLPKEEPESEELKDEIKSWLKQWSENEMEWSREDIWDTAEHFANWQKEQIIKRLYNHVNIDQMVEKFEDKYKPERVLDTEYYKRGIFDTIKAIKGD